MPKGKRATGQVPIWQRADAAAIADFSAFIDAYGVPLAAFRKA